jgi:signal transduction histidine kinase/phage shock protein PspC (stress-responsive transcriptional regulator)
MPGPRPIGDDEGTMKPVTTSAPTPGPAVSRPPLRRATEGRLVAGVASGLAEHLGVDTWLVRLGFVLLAFSGGAGLVAYAAFWALVPLARDPRDGSAEAGTAPAGTATGERAGRAEPAAPTEPEGLGSTLAPLLALGAVAAGGVLLLQQAGVLPGRGVAVPLVVLAVGVAVLWRVADDTQRSRWRATATVTAASTGAQAWVRVAAGVALVVVGAGAVLAAQGGFQAALAGVAGALVVLAGVALVLGPWLVRSARDLADERRERVRSQERAELAAHVHDSVLQTLTLIQRSAADPREVARLARAEERALRRWLYEPGDRDPTTFRAALEAAAADVEETHSTPLDVVVVGDAAVDERLGALLQAAREAMLNAARHAGAGGPVSVYAEVEPDQATVFVRDRGPGFDPETVPADRLGVRQSIVGRMVRNGGRAQIRSVPGEGTEVRLTMAREDT